MQQMQHNNNVSKFSKNKKYDFEEYAERIQSKKKKPTKRIQRPSYEEPDTW